MLEDFLYLLNVESMIVVEALLSLSLKYILEDIFATIEKLFKLNNKISKRFTKRKFRK